MPTYVYKCGACETTEEQIRKIADRDVLRLCRRCRRPMDRDVAAFEGAVYSPTSSTSTLRR